MSPPVDVSVLPATAQKILGGGAPAHMRAVAARGVLPGLKPDEIVTVVVALFNDEQREIQVAARETITKLAPPILEGALRANLQEPVVDALASAYATNAQVIEALLRSANMTGEIATRLAEGATESIGEILAVNEQFLLKNPTVIEKLYMNRRVRMSTADRLLELAVHNNVDLDIPIFKEVAAELKAELSGKPKATNPEEGDALYAKAEILGAELDKIMDATELIPVSEEDETAEVPVAAKSLTKLLTSMTITQKIRRAMLGNTAERMLLIRDKNRLVAVAAATSPLMRERDAEIIASSRAVIDDVLRCIARNREFVRSYQVKLNLVLNPRTPFTFSSRFIPHLRDNDVRNIQRSKGVSQAIKSAARQHLDRKKK